MFLDGQLDVGIKMLQVDSPTKTSITIDGTQGRMAEGYSSRYSRKWREIAYPYRPFFDSFTNTTMMKGWINFESLQDPTEFEEVVYLEKKHYVDQRVYFAAVRASRALIDS